jgi:hypothetical protein
VALLLVIAVALVPLFDRKPQTDLRSRPVVAILGVVVFVGFIVAWVVGHQVEATIDAGTIPQELLDERAIPPIPAPTFDVEAGGGASGAGTTEEVVE